MGMVNGGLRLCAVETYPRCNSKRSASSGGESRGADRKAYVNASEQNQGSGTSTNAWGETISAARARCWQCCRAGRWIFCLAARRVEVPLPLPLQCGDDVAAGFEVVLGLVVRVRFTVHALAHNAHARTHTPTHTHSGARSHNGRRAASSGGGGSGGGEWSAVSGCQSAQSPAYRCLVEDGLELGQRWVWLSRHGRLSFSVTGACGEENDGEGWSPGEEVWRST